LIDKLRAGLGAVLATAWVAIGAIVIFTVAGLVMGQLAIPTKPLSWLWLVGLGTVSTAFAFTMFLRGLAIVGPVTTSIITTAEPFFVAILAALVLGQPIKLQTVLGGSLIAIAVLVLSRQVSTADPMREQ